MMACRRDRSAAIGPKGDIGDRRPYPLDPGYQQASRKFFKLKKFMLEIKFARR